MGAIAGVVYPEFFPVSYAVGLAMDVLSSRCTGDPHTYLYKNVELGMRGERIGFNDQRSIALVLDGEIVNGVELAEKLQEAGFHAKGFTLPELLVRAYEHWGIAFACHLRGQFAIALYDQHKHELILTRDRLGSKPLYWAYLNNTFVFASELKGLLATGLVPQSPAKEAMGAYLYFGYLPQDLSPIEGVSKLLPGYQLRFGGKRKITVENYWSYSTQLMSEPSVPPGERLKTLNTLLGHAVARGLNGEGQVGLVASGSAGSASLAYYLSKSGASAHTKALSLSFVAQNDSDIEQARQISDTLHMEHQTFSLSPGELLNDLVRVAWQLDEPGADPAALAIWRLCRQNSGHLDTLFCDVGSDEIMATHQRYPQSLTEQEEAPILSWRGRLVSKTLLPFLYRLHPKSAFRLMRWLKVDPWYMKHVEAGALFPPRMLKALSPELSRYFAPDVYLHRFHNLSRLGQTPSSYLYFDTRTVLADKLLLEYDRLTAPHGVAWRSPFLDDDVVEFMAALPDEEKLMADETKRPLRRLLDKIMPGQEFVPSRPSSGFLTPWLHDAAIRRALEYLPHGTLVESGWISEKWLKAALAGKTNPPATFAQLWSILTLEIWYRLFINQPIGGPPDQSVSEFLRYG